jgi:hypothetical protein
MKFIALVLLFVSSLCLASGEDVSSAADISSASTAVSQPAPKTLVQVYYASTWGVWGAHNMGMRFLETGDIECFYYSRSEAKQVVYAQLGKLSERALDEIQYRIEELKNVELVPAIQCYDEVRMYYETGHGKESSTFYVMSMIPSCGTERKVDPSSSYLEGFVDSYFLQCPESPDAKKKESN